MRRENATGGHGNNDDETSHWRAPIVDFVVRVVVVLWWRRRRRRHACIKRIECSKFSYTIATDRERDLQQRQRKSMDCDPLVRTTTTTTPFRSASIKRKQTALTTTPRSIDALRAYDGGGGLCCLLLPLLLSFPAFETKRQLLTQSVAFVFAKSISNYQACATRRVRATCRRQENRSTEFDNETRCTHLFVKRFVLGDPNATRMREADRRNSFANIQLRL